MSPAGVHLLLSAGRGPAECAWALAQLLRRLEADAAANHVTARRVQAVTGDRPDTYRSTLISISGDTAAAFAMSWTGTLFWQAPSPYRAGHGRKNWYVTAQPCLVDVAHTRFAKSDVDIVACRTGGPGGQHRSKASTAVRATHRPTGTVVVVDTERRLRDNRRIALHLLRQRIEQDNSAAESGADVARWRLHDQLVRGDPVRVERPTTANHNPVRRKTAAPPRARENNSEATSARRSREHRCHHSCVTTNRSTSQWLLTWPRRSTDSSRTSCRKCP
jgi:peptide chain release factor